MKARLKMYKVGDRVWIKDMKEFGTILEIKGDDYHSDLKNGIDFSHFDNIHQTADDMFEELGWLHNEEYAPASGRKIDKYYYKGGNFITFEPNANVKTICGVPNILSLEEHLAIHQKMIEMGWIE
jgi:hypothetical protein